MTNPTDEQLRVMVAEAMGLEYPYCPNYTADLNSMHEVEMSLPDYQRKEFREQLCIVCLMDGGPIHATARQRCLAYLKAKGKL